mmetsp:Transcript_48089/g.108014  ORF Transcript_48089/g.108014 Transcript_48089/m.108014 type:complete len:688 (-) Transcript_48089:323-2386(-)
MQVSAVANVVGEGRCDECEEQKYEIFTDVSDGGNYCRQCWMQYYGSLPRLCNTPSSTKSLVRDSNAKAEDKTSSSDHAELLPHDAPPGHSAHLAVKYSSSKKACCFQWRGRGNIVHFQTTTHAAGGSRKAAEIIARSCYIKFEQGWTKDKVREFRNQCYKKVGGRAAPDREASQSSGQGLSAETQARRRAKQLVDPAAVQARAVLMPHQRRPMEPQPPAEKRRRVTEEMRSPGKFQKLCDETRQPAERREYPNLQEFLQPQDLKLLLDDPKAALPPKADVRSIRSQGLSWTSQMSQASQADSWLAHAERSRPVQLAEPQSQSIDSERGTSRAKVCCGCCCQAGCQSRSGQRHDRHPAGKDIPLSYPYQEVDCKTRGMKTVARRTPEQHAKEEASVQIDKAGPVILGRSPVGMSPVEDPEISCGKEPQKFKQVVPESQHRPETQPTPFCWGEVPPEIESKTMTESLPTPRLDETTPWPAPQPIPVPETLFESLSTPWCSQPTPKVEMTDWRYISDPTPLPPAREEEAFHVSSLPTPFPPGLPDLKQPAEGILKEFAKASPKTALLDEASSRGGNAAGVLQDAEVVTVSLDVPTLQRLTSVQQEQQASSIGIRPEASMAKPRSNFAALLLERSRAAATAKASKAESKPEQTALRQSGAGKPQQDPASSRHPPEECDPARALPQRCRATI